MKMKKRSRRRARLGFCDWFCAARKPSNASPADSFALLSAAEETMPHTTLDQHLAHLDDFHLAQRCLDQDAEAILWLRGHLTTVVAACLMRSGAQPAEALQLCENLLADLVMPMGKRRPRLVCYTGRCSLATWLHTVALNERVDRKRKEERWRTLIPASLNPSAMETGEECEPSWLSDPDEEESREAPLLELMRKAIEAAFLSCAPEDFVLLQLVHCDGLLRKELAVMFRCDPSRITERLAKAQEGIARTTLRHLHASDPWLELKWDDFTELCRTATPTCFGLD